MDRSKNTYVSMIYCVRKKSIFYALIELYINCSSCVNTPGRRQSKTFILSTNVDQNRLKQSLRLPFVASQATNGNRNTVSSDF